MKIKTKRGARRIRNQRVVTRRFVVTDYTGCPYITAGKRYPVGIESGLVTLTTLSDDNDFLMIMRPDAHHKCPHLNDVARWQWVVI